MTRTIDRLPSTAARRPRAMYVGLALTILATLVPLLDVATVDTLSDHVRDAYPDWHPSDVAADRDAIAIYLIVTNAVGILLWLLTIRALTRGKRWARAAATIGFSAGVVVALTNLSVGGDQYDLIVPYWYGALTLPPCFAGLTAVISLWRRDRSISPA